MVRQHGLGRPLFQYALVLQSGHAIGGCEIRHVLLSHANDTVLFLGLDNIGSITRTTTRWSAHAN
jgi:hypothetical protein